MWLTQTPALLEGTGIVTVMEKEGIHPTQPISFRCHKGRNDTFVSLLLLFFVILKYILNMKNGEKNGPPAVQHNLDQHENN